MIDDGYTAKLADFGLSVFYGSGSTTLGSRAAGAIRFCAPELLESESVDPTPASDIWAFACFCIEVSRDV